MFIVVVHVILRYFFVRPIPGAHELIEFSMALVVCLGLGYCAAQGANVRVDMFVSCFPRRFQALVDALTSLLSIGILSLITWQAVVQAKDLFDSGQISGVLYIPHFPFLILLALGCGIFDLVFVANFLESLRGALRK
jgi:TRAP-type C4-dicarboxylate transport system permease small subunit